MRNILTELRVEAFGRLPMAARLRWVESLPRFTRLARTHSRTGEVSRIVQATLVLARETSLDVRPCIWCAHDVESGARGSSVAKDDVMYLAKRVCRIVDVGPTPDNLVAEI